MHEEICCEENISTLIFLFAKDDRTITSGRVARGAVFQELRPGAGFKTGDFVKEKLGGRYRSKTQTYIYIYTYIMA